MGSQSVEIIRQGIWASLTGGWYYDPHQNVFCNTFHLYLWLYLMCVPFCVYLYASWWWIGWISHLIVLALVAFFIKGCNYLLHHMFDTGECLQEEVGPETPTLDGFRPSVSSQNASSIGHQRTNSFEALEMQVVSTNRGVENTTPPVGCSSRNSMISSNNLASSTTQAAPAVIDLKVDVHHKDSSGSEEGSLKPQDSEVKSNCQNEHLGDENQNVYQLEDSFVTENPSGIAINDTSEHSSELRCKSREGKINSYESRSNIQKSSSGKESHPTRHRKKPKHDPKTTSLTRTSDLEGCLASTSYKKDLLEDCVLTSTSHHSSGSKAPSTTRSCRATPESLFQSRNLSISKGERSCSAPNCSIEVSDGSGGMNLIHRLSFCQEHPYQEASSLSKSLSKERERKGKKNREEKRGEGCDSYSPRDKGKDDQKGKTREKDKKVNDIDSEEDPSAKDSSSPLLIRSQGSNESSSHKKGQRLTSSRPYHPLVCRRTTSLAKDDLKVTTLTFENVYADEESERNTIAKSSSSSSSDEPLESPPPTSKECNKKELLKSGPSPIPSTSRAEEEERGVQTAPPSHEKCEDNSSTSSSSSCPDIEWLFCHSESDSEFSNVAKTILTQRLKKGCSHPQNRDEEDEEDEDSWTAIRSSPEADELPHEGKERKLSIRYRDPEGTSKHGAIPKQRRQGVVVRDGEIGADGGLPPEGEAAGVTMDLVRKMLDVFSSYPDNRSRDIKKLLVLVSLEQDSRRAHSNSSGGSDSADQSVHSASKPVDLSKDAPLKDEDKSTETLETNEPLRERKPQETNKTTVLHRKPAVRRRRNQFDSFESSSSVDKCGEGKSHKEYQTTLSGAVSYFGNSDEENANEAGSRKPYRKSSTTRKFSPESLLPLSAFEGLPAPAIHLATCHDDTTNGAVHCFQDERGHWFTYTFNNTIAACSASSSTTPSLFPQIRDNSSVAPRGPSLAPEDASLSSSSMSLCSGLTVVLDSQAPSSPLSGPPWSESGKPNKESRPPTHTSPPAIPPSLSRRISCPPNNAASVVPHREVERTGRGGILGEVMERSRNPNRSSTSGPGAINNSRSAVPRDILSSGPPHLHLLNLGTPGNPLQLFTSAIFDRTRIPHRMNTSETDPYYDANMDVDMSLVKQLKFSTPAPQTTQYYKLKLFGKKTIKVHFDRLSLLALLDRNLTLTECLATAFLVTLVGALGCMVLQRGFYQEFKAFIFCVVMASSQYSLFRSVQPDAASPTHGYNRVVLYSRPVYFCICCSIVLALDFYLEKSPGGLPTFILYGMELTSPYLLLHLRNFLLFFLLLFPLFFSLGLLPQVNTFLTYFLEQIDMHVFGGNATTGLSSAFYCVLRSVLAVLFLTGFAYGGLREEAGNQHILYSIFCALTVAFAYHLSRSGANPSVLWQLIKKHLLPEEIRGASAPKEDPPDEDPVDPLPKKLRSTVTNRLMHDSIVCTGLLLIVFALHSSTVFAVLLRGHQGPFPDLLIGLWITACLLGFLNHYLIPQLRTQQPWMCVARPACMTYEYSQFEAYDAAKVMWFEKLYVWLCLLERNILYPIIFLCALTQDAEPIMQKHPTAGTFMIVICGLKCLRTMYSQTQFQYLVLAFTVLFFNWDSKGASETFLVNYFFMSIVFSKAYEFLLKLKFIVTYIAPWQITWGSAFHAFAQPFSVPHSAMLFVQAAISAVLSTPLNPILGSAIFITSYVRPVKFWERDYNTKRIDHSNTRLSSLLEQNPGADDNNLNSIFYEHLTRSLQHSLCGDLIMGRWGSAAQGDCFVLASDNLNCLVHIIEMGNGLVTFQVRGLEFRGTYCQQREVEAISEGVEEDRGCCCCEPGHLPHMLSPNAAFNQRWLAWEVTATKYILEGYSISDNSATSMFQMFELRKILITYYVKSIIFFVIQSPKLEEWLTNEDISRSLASLREKKFADLDPTFHAKIDDDYDPKESGITRNSFCNVYFEWIAFCVCKRKEKPRNLSVSKDSLLVSLCLALSLLGRRALGPSSQCDNVDVFLQFLHSLFKGDIRPTCVRDEWVFGDMELLRKVVAPALRISLKLHQDHFLLPDEYDNHEALYSALLEHQATLVICHEGDPQWRAAVLSGRPSLLSLRHVNDDGEDKFKVIMLNKRHLLFRVIKVNRECVRGLWAGQQQELVYLRNRNPERGSIQNAKQALRNIINSSCDQPIGYPIYVSPLTTSYADTHDQLSGLCGSSITPKLIKETAISICNRLRERCIEGCSSGSSGRNEECSRVHNIPEPFQNSNQLHQVLSSVPLGPHLSQDGSPIGSLGLMSSSGGMPLGGSLSGHSLSGGSLQATRGSLMSTVSSLMGPQNKQSSSTLASLAGMLTEGGANNLRQGYEGESREYSHREKSSIHNSRDSLTYNVQREGGPQWDAVGTVDFRDKRGQGGGSRGSSMSGITFLSREAVPVGPTGPPPPPPAGAPTDSEWEWEMGPSEMSLCTTGSVHSLHSSSSIPHQGGTPPPPPPPPSSYSSGTSHHSHEGGSVPSHDGKFSSLHDLPTRSYHHHHGHHKAHLQQHHQRHPSSTWTHDGGGGVPNIASEKRRKHQSPHRVRIMDANQVYDTLNLGRRIDVIWPDEFMRSRGGRNFWGNWVPVEGMEGTVIHTWKPHHPDPKLRSHVERTIYLVQIQDKFVPVAKNGVRDLTGEENS